MELFISAHQLQQNRLNSLLYLHYKNVIYYTSLGIARSLNRFRKV